jgi:type II secretory pathway component PulF
MQLQRDEPARPKSAAYWDFVWIGSSVLRVHRRMSKTTGHPAITTDQLIALSDQLRALVRCGVPLEPSLMHLSQELTGDDARVVAELAEESQTGKSLEHWLESKASQLPPIFRAIVRAGIRAGQLDGALQGFVATIRRAADLRRTVGVALLYPLVIVVLISLLASAILQRMAQQYQSLQQSGAIADNSPVARVIPILHSVGSWIWVLAPIALVVSLLWWLQTRRAALLQPARFVRWMGWLPGVGRMVRSGRLSIFSDVLGLLIQNDVPLDEALTLAADASGDRATRTEAEALRDQIQQGGHIAFERKRNTAISPLIRWLLSSQTDRDHLASALHAHAQAERRHAEYLSQWLRVQAPVILTLGVGGTVTFLYAFSILGPWYSLLYEFARPR